MSTPRSQLVSSAALLITGAALVLMGASPFGGPSATEGGRAAPGEAANEPPPVERAAAETVVLVGGHYFTGERMAPNTGIVARAGKLMVVDGGLSEADVARYRDEGAEIVRLADAQYVLPGFFDLHAHYGVEFIGDRRTDETEVNPVVFLANGVTTTFPGGEMDPDDMRALRLAIDRGERVGPRLLNSGPYFGTARPGWNRDWTAEDIYAEVDRLVERGARGFKAKGISPEHLRPLIERAHRHGRTVTGHLDSGFRNSVNPRDAILMGIDRIEHFLGGDALPADRSAYASLVDFEPGTPEFDEIARLYIEHGVNFDATVTAYGYYGERDPRVFTKWVDEMKFLTPYARARVEESLPRRVNERFERIYNVKLKTIKAFYDAGGGHLITLGTDHPSWGEFLAGFSVHRELHAFTLAGIPEAAALRTATINAARAIGLGDRLGTIEAGKWADLVIVDGDPLEDIRNTRNVRTVMKAGELYDPAALLASVEGEMGPDGPAVEAQ